MNIIILVILEIENQILILDKEQKRIYYIKEKKEIQRKEQKEKEKEKLIEKYQKIEEYHKKIFKENKKKKH